MKLKSGFTLLEVLLYVVIGGVTLIITAFSFAQINRLTVAFQVNNELNQTGASIIKQLENIIAINSDTIISPVVGTSATSKITTRKGSVDTTIEQVNTNLIVSYNNGDPSYNLNPSGIILSDTLTDKISFQQVNNNLSQSIKVKFKLVYKKPTFSSTEYESERNFETTIILSQRKASFQPILNQYPTGANGVAYGLRKLSGLNTSSNLSNGYTGAAIRVRRDRGLDQEEMDIGFTSSGDLNTVALQNFVGYQNFINYSEDIVAANWNLTNLTTISNATSSPDGNDTAERVNLSVGNNQKSISKNTNIVSGSTYTDSYYVKANNGYNFVQIAPDTGFSSTAYQNYNLSNGTLASSSGISAGQANIESIGNSWYRISLTATANATTSGRMILSVINNATSARLEAINITVATDAIFVWGGMRHLGNTLKVYQKTLADANTGDAYVKIWYDQSGNSNNAIQNTTATQPKIVDGVNGIITINTKPVLQFDGIDDELISSSFDNGTNSTAFFIASRSASSKSFMARLTNYAIVSNDLFNTYYLNKSSIAATIGSDIKNSLNLYMAIRNSAINSSLNIGTGSAGNFLNGRFAELIIYNGNKLTNRTDIENNLRDYYGTP